MYPVLVQAWRGEAVESARQSFGYLKPGDPRLLTLPFTIPLSAAGLLSELERVFNGVDRINRVIEDMRATTVGTIQIAATPTLADNLLPPAIALFHRTRPNVRIIASAMDNFSVVGEVAREHVDIGLALSPFTHVDARQIELCAAELVCIVPQDSPLATRGSVTPVDLADYPLISFRKTLPLGLLVEEAFRKAGVTQNFSLEVNQSSVACALVRAGAGVAIVDPFWLIDNSERGLVRLTLRPRAEVSAQALVSKNASLSRPAQLFLTALRKTADAFKRDNVRISREAGQPGIRQHVAAR